MNNDTPGLVSSASVNDSVADAADDQAPCSASALLRNAREAKNLTQKDIAERLFLSAALIRHIDADRLDEISKPAFVRGYLRAYAKLVDLDGDMVVTRYELSNNHAPAEPALKPVANASLGSATFTGPVLPTAIAGLVALALVIGIVWYTSSDDTSMSASAMSASANSANPSHAATDLVTDTPETDPVQSLALPLVTSMPDVDNAAPVPANIEAENTSFDGSAQAPIDVSADNDLLQVMVDLMLADRLGVEAVRAVTVSRESHGETRIVNIDADGDDSLNFIFTGNCWLEVRDAEERLLYEDLGTAGLEIRIEGIAPFKILIGKTSALSLRYQGEVIDLNPYTTSAQTAILSVGE